MTIFTHAFIIHRAMSTGAGTLDILWTAPAVNQNRGCLEAARKHRVSLDASYMIGDSITDIQAGPVQDAPLFDWPA